jgi:hypothetical protein
MLTPIEYEEYHALYGDHLMRDVDILPDFRIIEVEFYNRDIKWFKSDTLEFHIGELRTTNPIRNMLIS